MAPREHAGVSSGAESAARIASTIWGGSLMRPGPYSPQAISPSSGPTNKSAVRAQPRDIAPRRRISHMRTFIAGANRTRLSVASKSVVARSSASPCAARARRFAVAGATTMRSAWRESCDMSHLAFARRVEEIGVDLALLKSPRRRAG